MVLEELGYAKTGREEEFPESAACFAVLPGEWLCIVLQRVEVDDGTIDLHKLSLGAEVVTCFVEEHVMCSSASGWADGAEIWSVRHVSEVGKRHLEVTGTLPPGSSAIVDEATSSQDKEDQGDAECDFIFDIPVDIAMAVAGHRHDQSDPSHQFEALEKVPRPTPQRPGWFRSLFGAGRGR